MKKDASTSQTDQKPEQEVVLRESSHNGVRKKESPKAGASKVDRSKEANAGKSAVKKDASTSQTDQKPEQEVVIKESSHNGVGKKESTKAGASKVDRCSGAKRRRKLATDGSHRQKSSTPNSTRQKTKSNHEASEATNGSRRQNSSTPKSRRQKTKLAGEASEATGGSSIQNSSTPNSKRRKTKSDHEASNPVLSGKKIAKTAKSSSGTPKTKEKLSDRIQTRSRKSIAWEFELWSSERKLIFAGFITCKSKISWEELPELIFKDSLFLGRLSQLLIGNFKKDSSFSCGLPWTLLILELNKAVQLN